jgi:outer membrane protein assembly factor BamA
MNVSIGDTIPFSLTDTLRTLNENLLYNTQLFNYVTIQDSIVGNQLYWHIYVEERWYLWPYFYWEIAEQTINDWLESPSLNRITLNGGVDWMNLSGRNDHLSIGGSIGYFQSFSISYRSPLGSSPKKLTDFYTQLSFKRQREIFYDANSEGDLLRYRSDLGFLFQEWEYNLLLRPRLSQYQFLSLFSSLRSLRYDPYVLALNPNFFGEIGYREVLTQSSFGILLEQDYRNIRYYPTKGSRFILEMTSHCLFHQTQMFPYFKTHLRYLHFLPLVEKRLFYATGGYGQMYFSAPSMPFFRQFHLQGALDLRGFQRYRIPGDAFFAWKNEIRLALLPRRIVFWKKLPKHFQHFPLGLYTHLFTDFGYAYSKQPMTKYNNHPLLAYGIGLDFLTFYDNVFRLELLFNNFRNIDFLIQAKLNIQ